MTYISLNFSGGNLNEPSPTAEAAPQPPQPTVIPGADSLIGDLLDIDIGGPTMAQQQMYPQQPQVPTPVQQGGMDLLGEGLDNLVCDTFYNFASWKFDLHLMEIKD